VGLNTHSSVSRRVHNPSYNVDALFIIPEALLISSVSLTCFSVLSRPRENLSFSRDGMDK
jgi:hypothetical protein